MLGPYFFGNVLGDPPRTYFARHDWATWISLGMSTSSLPAEIRLHKDYPQRDWANEATLPSGRFRDVDWACEPDWWRTETWWRGWIPTDSSAGDRPWYIDMDEKDAYVTSGSRFMFPDLQRRARRADLQDLQAGIEAIVNLGTICADTPTPPLYDDSVLDGTFNTIKELRNEGARSKRAALDRVGWLIWWINAIPTGLADLPNDIRALVGRDLHSLYCLRGFVIDLAQDWGEINLSFWVFHNVPVFYAWGFDENNDDRFCRLRPEFVILEEEFDNAPDVFPDRLPDDKRSDLIEKTWHYDDYLQSDTFDTAASQLVYGSDVEFVVIDFEGHQIDGRRFLALET
ncbi:hypothetical protein M413DRAFT_10525 [Hebeloma cylindrosporum]|uniref:Uncharacterized protein n=1 Tax=Hebeloma cylindrosporum TaxID=76867 RepID=A0A0C3CFH6_HEBCY|nr:hypothetical protein M413DRAFT_10525 [Hebeloma cylindrosporum h7]